MRRSGLIVLLLLATLCSSGTLRAADTQILFSSLQFSGDFRYRHEGIFVEDTPDRLRHRIRLRVGAKAAINKYFDVSLRLATSTPGTSDVGDPISTNQDLGGGLAPKTIWVDRAYATFQPIDEFNATAGKFGSPYHSTDLLFDPDLNLEGIAASAQRADENASFLPFAHLGGFWLQERPTGPDQALFGGQAGVRFKQDRITLMGAAAYYDYTNVKGHPVFYLPNRNYGNTVLPGGPPSLLYANDYDLLDVNVQFQYKLDRLELTALGNFIQNLEPDSDHTAWLAGCSLKGKSPLAWDFCYNYRVLESDAVIGAFTDSDFAGGGTNAEGHRLSGGITPWENTRLGITWFINTRDPDGTTIHYERLMADLEIKF